MSDELTNFDVLVPSPYSPYAMEILAGSGVVGYRSNGIYLIDYEGNRYGASNLEKFEERLLHAAGRAAERYPTVARLAPAALDAFVKVGEYDYSTKELTLYSNPASLRMLERWLEHEPLPVCRREVYDGWRTVQIHATAIHAPVSVEDADVAGVYDVEIPPLLLADNKAAAAALYRFHCVVPVSMPEDFEFTVRDGGRDLGGADEDVPESAAVLGGAVSKREVVA